MMPDRRSRRRWGERSTARRRHPDPLPRRILAIGAEQSGPIEAADDLVDQGRLTLLPLTRSIAIRRAEVMSRMAL